MEKICVVNVKPIEGKNQLRAFADVSFDNEITVLGIRLMHDGKEYWIGFPQNTYEANGQKRYSPYVQASEGLKKRIKEVILEIYESNQQ